MASFCSGCAQLFPKKRTDGHCQKCKKIDEAPTAQEKATLGDYGQCPDCGITAKNLRGVCGRCSASGDDALSVARNASSILKTASQVAQRAEEHRSNATKHRMPGLGSGKAKGTKVVQERLDARKLAHIKSVQFVVDFAYTIIDPPRRQGKANLISSLKQSSRCENKTKMHVVFGDIRERAKLLWSSLNFDTTVGTIFEKDIHIALIVNKESRLIEEDDYKMKTVGDALEILATELSWTNAKDASVPLRAMIHYYPGVVDMDEPPTRTRNKRSRKVIESEDEDEFTSAPTPPVKKIQSGVFSSSFSSRPGGFSSLMTTVRTIKTFTKITPICAVEDGVLDESKQISDKHEELVVKHGINGLEKDQKADGYYKGCVQGVYAEKDVVIAIAEGNHDINYDAEDNHTMLFQEARALALGKLMATLFFERLDKTDEKVQYKFTFNDGFIADFGETKETSSYYRTTRKILCRQHALVTPLLPNWPADFVKFCGAECNFDEVAFGNRYEHNISEETYNKLKPILMAFVHFAFAESGCKVIFTDIQGAWSSKQSMFIIADPQVHTTFNEGEDLNKWASWDNKNDGVASFFNHHKCGKLCKHLGLDEASLKFPQKGLHRSWEL